MTYSSHPCEDEGEKLGLHGRISNIPAEDVGITKSWEGSDYCVRITGRVRETAVFGHKLLLRRSIETSLGSSKLIIRDLVENTGFDPSPLMMLYHVNIGWPVVSEHSQLFTPTTAVKPFDDEARREIDMWSTFLPPQETYPERVYLHTMKPDNDDIVRVALVNRNLRLGVYLSYPAVEFPHFIQWKMMRRGEYVVGIEPGNITGNRAAMRRDGTLEYIGPGRIRPFTLEIGILDGDDDIASFVSHIPKAIH
jgi:hypothetical protein